MSAIAAAGRASAVYSKSLDLGYLNVESWAPDIYTTAGRPPSEGMVLGSESSQGDSLPL